MAHLEPGHPVLVSCRVSVDPEGAPVVLVMLPGPGGTEQGPYPVAREQVLDGEQRFSVVFPREKG